MTPTDKAELRATGEAMVVENHDQGDRAILLDALLLLAKRKSFLLKFVGGAAVLSVIVSLLLPKSYTAQTQIMPPQQNQSMGNAAMLSQLGPLAALAGQGMGGLLKSPSDVYVSVLKSRSVGDALVDHFSLMQVYGLKLREDARRKLADHSDIRAEKDGIITVAVEDRDPQRAADLANGYADELQKLTKTLAITEAGRRRIFFEGEMKKASDDLATAEEALKETQEKTGLILLDPQSRAMITMASTLRAQVAAKAAEVQAMRSFATPENPDLVRAEQELGALQAQVTRMEGGQRGRGVGDVPLENVPTAGLEYIRKYRDVRYHEALYELLAKQYEAARIDEGRDSVVVQQLDKAVRPERKSWPKRSLIVLTVTFLAFLTAILIVFAQESLAAAKEDPQFTTRLQLLRFYLRGRQQP